MKTIKVLLIEDVSDDRNLVKELLDQSELPVELEEAASSPEGLEKLKSNSYDCVLIDYVIPGVTGLEVLQLSREAGVDTPFIFMTGYGDSDLAHELIRKGASDYLNKMHLSTSNLQGKITRAVNDP